MCLTQRCKGLFLFDKIHESWFDMRQPFSQEQMFVNRLLRNRTFPMANILKLVKHVTLVLAYSAIVFAGIIYCVPKFKTRAKLIDENKELAAVVEMNNTETKNFKNNQKRMQEDRFWVEYILRLHNYVFRNELIYSYSADLEQAKR